MKGKKVARVLSCIMAASLLLEPVSQFAGMGPQVVYAAEEEGDPYLISTNKTITVSSVQDVNSGGDKVSDGSNSTRWESAWSESTAWLEYDLGIVSDITSIYLNWEGACATNYEIKYSTDGNEWTTKKTVTDGKAGEITFDDSEIQDEARYIRLECQQKSMPAYGYSLYEMQIYGYNGLYKVNLAQGKPAEGSSFLDEWWMKDENGNIKPAESPDAVNAVDGNASTRWRSSNANEGFAEGAGQWVWVDLEKSYMIGEVDITWDGSAAATVYDIQLSDDGQQWNTVYRNLKGDESKQTIKLHNEGRYVRLLCHSRYRDAYVAVKELEVYKYMDGDEIVTHEIPKLPTRTVVQVTGEDGNGKGSYNSNDIYFANQARDPKYLADELSMPIASNDWWQSILINDIGNALSVLPVKAKFEKQNGLGILTMGQSYWKPADDYTQGAVTSTTSESQMDFYVVPADFNTDNVYNEVAGYGDYHVKANFYDGNGLSMVTTHVKGNPYTFIEFNNKEQVYINSVTNTDEDETESIVEIFDGIGNMVLANVGDTVTTDHIGFKVVDNDNEEKTMTSVSYYSVNVPEDTMFERREEGITVSFAGDETYMSIAAMTDKSQIGLFYEHGYAFVTDTVVTYQFDEETNVIASSYNLTTKTMRENFTDQSIQCLLPHQWDKYTADLNGGKELSDITYRSSRGDMRVFEGNSFTMSDIFYGMLPEFTTPENEEYDEEELLAYLANLATDTSGNLIGSDAYWQGKSLHPLGLGALVADQIGNTEYRDLFLSRIKTIMEDWYTYDGPEDEAFLFYDTRWGTLYYKDSEFGANKDISDHHFTYGYLLFASAVLATYDDEFYQDYKDMMDLLVRDYASPYEDDEMFCKFRSFDPYEGHSWAGGYADNDGGNNQEAASESLFGWVGMYLWSQCSENEDFRDASIYGFTTEINAIKHYWFDYYQQKDDIDGYDRSGWPSDWPSKSIGQVYGSNYFYGTFFGGYPIYVYGIHWLPVTEYMTYYGMEKEQASALYQGLLTDTQGQKDAYPDQTDYPDTTNSWQHIALPFLSLTDPDQALSELDRSTQSRSEGFNTYWFLNNMKDLGKRTSDIYATGGVSATVYEKEVNGEKVYTAMAWNPTDHAMEVKFRDAEGIVGSATIGAKSLLRLNPQQTGAVQVETPEFSVPAGTYQNTQYVKITSATEGATLHYTTDGTSPTEDSPVYEGRIPVSSTTTIKAIAVKDGYIKSAMKSATIVINGSSITTGTNIAKGKEAFASSTEGGNAANLMLDGDAGTRWSSLTTDDEYCYVDLGETYSVNKVKIKWEASYASKYEIQVSTNGNDWTTVYTEDTGKGGFEEIIFDPVEARYVKMQGVKRATNYGYSIYELGIYEARQASAPQFSLESGSYEGNQLLSIASGTNGVEIRYTTDGSEPTKDSKLYIPRLTLFENTTITAKAFKQGMIPSEVSSAHYDITGGTNPGNVDNYDENDSFKVEADPVIEEEKIAGEVESDADGDGETEENPLVTGNLAYKKKVTVTSSENANSSGNVTDGNLNTTWSSAFAEDVVEDRHNQSCYIDLKESVEFNKVTIYWALNTPDNVYEIQVSDDANEWTTVYVYDKETGAENVDVSTFDTVKARYVKMQGIQVGAGWGYAIREMTVALSEEEQPFGENIAANAKVTASGADEGYPASNIKDQNAETAWKVSETDSAQINLDLYKTYKIDKVKLQLDGYVGTYTVSVSTDGTNFNPVKEGESTLGTDSETVTFEAVDARYVRIEFANATNGISMKEFEIYTIGSTEAVEEVVTYYQAESATSSSNQGDGMSADYIIDGDSGTRWGSAQESDDEWCIVDLGEGNVKTINRVEIDWENAYATQYTIDVSVDGVNFTTVRTVEAGEGGNEVLSFSDTEARYIRMQGIERATQYGYSIYEMRIGYVEPIHVTSILVSPTLARLDKGETLQLTWSINPSNATNQNVRFTSGDEDIVMVDEEGKLHAVGAGETFVTATTEDGGLTAQTQVKVKGALDAPTVSVRKLDTNQAVVSWTSVANAVAYEIYYTNSLSGNYTKLADVNATQTEYQTEELTEGTYYFKVIAKADATSELYLDSVYSSVSNAITIENENNNDNNDNDNNNDDGNGEEPTEVTLSLDSYSGTLKVGESLTVTATVNPADTVVTWRSEDPTIAYVNDGTITALKAGTVVITVTAGNQVKEYHLTVTAKEAVQPDTTPDNQPGTTPGTGTDTGTENGSGTNAGNQTGGSDGKNPNTNPDTDVEGDDFDEDEDDEIPAKKITLNTKRIYIVKGRSIKVKATMSPLNSTDEITWKTSKKSVATVKNGKIKAKKVGKTTITAKTSSGKKVTCKVYVVKKAKKSTSIKLNKKKVNMKVGQQITLKPTVKPYNSTDTVKWSSSKKKVATVDGFGTITAKKKGTVVITAKTSSGKKVKCTIKIK